MQLLVFSLSMKPMTAEKKAQVLVGDEYEKARICLQGQNHEGFQVQNSTTNADAHLLRLFLAVQANPKHVLASLDVSNAFLNAELSEDIITLTQTAELVQFGLGKPATLYQCTKACYGLREAPKASKLWEEARDKTLTSFVFQIDHQDYSLRQSTYHPNLWFVVRAPCQTISKQVCLPDDSDLPDIAVFGEHEHIAALLVCVDDFLAAGPTESFSDKPHVEPHAQKARVKHPPLQPGQDPLEHAPVLRLVGVLLWVSLRTRPDISWAVARITRLATSEARAPVCIRHVAQYLRWTLHFALGSPDVPGSVDLFWGEKSPLKRHKMKK